MSYIEEFGRGYAIPAAVIALSIAGILADSSWHNDVCPSFERGERRLWIDHPDPSQREIPNAPRYSVCLQHEDGTADAIYHGDCLTTALDALRG